MVQPSPEHIEHLQRRRTRLTLVQAVLFLGWQANFMMLSFEAGPGRQSAYHAKVSAYVVWVGLLLVFLSTGGNWWASREVRAVLNDEVTRAHRQRAMAIGFFGAMGAALGCYVVSLFEPVSGPQAIHVILSVGMAAALLAFGILERRAQGG